jgi:hypothetical protein
VARAQALLAARQRNASMQDHHGLPVAQLRGLRAATGARVQWCTAGAVHTHDVSGRCPA